MKLIYQNIKHCCAISLIDRYLIERLGWLFIFSVALLTILGVSIGTVSELAYKITEYQLPKTIAVLVFCSKIPEYGAYALPISVLLTSLTVYSQLSRDREITALFSFGVSFYRLILPALVFGLLVTVITFCLNELVVPAANYQANLLQNPYIAKTESNLQNQDIYYAEYELGRANSKQLKNIYFAEKYQQPQLNSVTIISFEKERLSRIITAQFAQWNQQQQLWDLFQGTINHVRDSFSADTVEEFTYKQLPLSAILFEIVSKKRSVEDMSIRQAREYLASIEDSSEPIYLAKLTVRIQQKYAFPFICTVFMLVGAALGTKYARLNRARCFALCVGIVFGYYCLGFAIGSLGITGVISSFWAAWLPNFIALGVGVYLLMQANS